MATPAPAAAAGVGSAGAGPSGGAGAGAGAGAGPSGTEAERVHVEETPVGGVSSEAGPAAMLAANLMRGGRQVGGLCCSSGVRRAVLRRAFMQGSCWVCGGGAHAG